MLGKILSHCFIKAKKPTKVWIGVTDHCNSHCTMCNQWLQKGTPKEEMLTPEDYKRIFSDPYLSDIDSIIISGGEPTLREDLFEIIVALHEALPKAEIGISTNGLLPDRFRDLIDKLEQTDIKFNVGVSLESYDRNIDEQIRGAGHLNKASECLDSVDRIKNKVCIGTMILPENIFELPSTMGYFADHGIETILQMPEESAYYNDVRLSPEKPYHIREFVAGLPDRFNMLREQWLKYLDGKPYNFKCYAMRDFFGLCCDGEIVSCLKKWNAYRGNVKTHSIKDLLSRGWGDVNDCKGCLNTWGCYWSWQADGWPYLLYYLRHPVKFIRKMIS